MAWEALNPWYTKSVALHLLLTTPQLFGQHTELSTVSIYCRTPHAKFSLQADHRREVSLFQVIYSFLMRRTPLLCTKCCLWSLLFHLRDAKQKLTNEMKVNLITKTITFFKTNSSLSLQQGKIQIETLWQCWRNIWGWGERGTAWQVCWKLNVDYPWVQKWINVFYSIILMKWLIWLL